MVKLEREVIIVKKYKIRVEDKFHQTASEHNDFCHYYLSEYKTYQEAIKACRDFLDRDFESIVKDCKNKDDFYNYWSFHGERLYIYPGPDNNRDFNSDKYIEEKIKKHFKN